MPTYCYKRPDGAIVEVTHSISETPKERIKCADGVIAERDFRAEHGHVDVNPNWRNFKSVALGCHPEQVPEFAQHLQAHGVKDFSFNERGDFIAHSRKARDGALKARGMVDFDKFG